MITDDTNWERLSEQLEAVTGTGASIYGGYFKIKYGPLKGRDWLRSLPKWERRAFAMYGLSKAEWGRLGGIARAASAARDDSGRFAVNP